MNIIISLFVALLVSGCASMGFQIAGRQSAVFEPRAPLQSQMVQDVDLEKQSCFTVVRVPLPSPRPAVLQWDINDSRRIYFGEDRVSHVLRRYVWRVPVFARDRDDPIRAYNALINPTRTGFAVLVPGCGMEIERELLKQNLLIVSADACFVMTTRQGIVPLPEFGKLPDGFLEKHPSPITPDMISRKGENTEEGRLFLSELRAMFPDIHLGKSSARPRKEISDIATLTPNASIPDRFVTEGSGGVSLGTFAALSNPVGLTVLAIQNRNVPRGLCEDVHRELGLIPETSFWQGEQ